MKSSDYCTILAEPIHSGLHIHVYEDDISAIQNAVSLSASMHHMPREMILQGGEDALMERVKTEIAQHKGVYIRELLMASQKGA